MIKMYHNSNCGRVAVTLLLITGILGFWALPAQAQSGCGSECDSPLMNEIHTWDPGMDKSMCPPPEPDFCACPNEGCDSLLVYFYDYSVGYIDTWEWDFGDPASGADNYSNEENPTHWYMSTGTYSITLTVTGPGGTASITKDHYVIILTAPTADFTSNITEGCAELAVLFTDMSTGADEWLWDFGDGQTSAAQNPSHTYTSPGTYTVSLIATNICGPDVKTRVDYITVFGDPTADFSGTPTWGYAPLDVKFTDLSTSDVGIDTWSWDFGDPASGADNYSDVQNPSHIYTAAGKYTVKLTITNSNPKECNSDTEIKTEYIVVDTCGVDFYGLPREGCAELTVTFVGNVTGPCEISSWSWNFGDPASGSDNTGSGQVVQHTYKSAGKFTVILTAVDATGTRVITKIDYITVYEGPTADFTSDVTDGCAELEVHFFDRSTGAETWSWDFGDGATSDVQDPIHTYINPGKYTVKLTITNDNPEECNSDTEEKIDYITVYGGPTAKFGYDPASGLVPLLVKFIDSSTSEVGLDSWSWDFGDGGTSSVQHPSHTYTTGGTFPVTLIVSDKCGKDTVTHDVKVYDTCWVDFTGVPEAGCAELDVEFTGIPKGPCEISSWTWDFGDPASGSDNTGSGQIVVHTYKLPGKYTVKLTADDVSGEKTATKVDYITVYGGPTADFVASPTSGCAPLMVDFMDLSTSEVGIESWTWDFGDPASGSDNVSDQQNPSHEYNSQGRYAVSLIVKDSCGADTATGEIIVPPELSITKSVDSSTAHPNSTLEYSLTIVNNKDEISSNITVVDTIPDSAAIIVPSITGGGIYDPVHDHVIWSIASLGPHQQDEFSFKVLLDGPFVTFPTEVSNYATGTIWGPTAKNGYPLTFVSDTVTTVVNDKPTGQLEISKEVDVTLASPGDLLTYTISVFNNDMVAAENVIVADTIPDSTTYYAGAGYDPVSRSMTWDLGTMNPYERQHLTFQVTIDTDVGDGQQIINGAAILSPKCLPSNKVMTAVSVVPLVITKTVDRPSAMIGDLVRFTIDIQNYSADPYMDVVLIDTMPSGIFYVDGTSLRNDSSVADPAGDNPYRWSFDELPASRTFTVEYTALVGASAHPGMNENVAWAVGYQNEIPDTSNRAVAQIYVLTHTLTGSIRGRVIVDCDGDGIPDTDSVPSGADVYLDDGSQSRVNEKGMFYFSTVRAGEHTVTLDERDLEGYFIPEGAQASVFVHVHETGESYVIFRICPEYPHLDISKEASIVPAVKVTKTAKLNPEQISDSLGVMIDYEIDIKSNGLADPTQVRVVDSFPENTRFILEEQQPLTPERTDNQLVYEVTAAQERLQKSAYYSLRDLSPGVRRFLTNKVHLEGDVARPGEEIRPVFSEPVEVEAGPFQLAPPKDVVITLTPAFFNTGKAFLLPPAAPQLEAVADSIEKYADAGIKVEGHCDYRPIHTRQFPSNWELGEARAKAVVDWLVENRKIDPERLEYKSYAATRPVDPGRTPEAWQRNRRVEVIIQARIAALLDTGVLPAEKWESSTLLSLNPVKFDTLFEPAHAPMEIGLDGSWEVAVTIENTGAIAAENAILADILPGGAEYIDNSASVDGRSILVSINGDTLNVKLEKIEPLQKLELWYRIRALKGRMPTGGGAASVEVRTPDNVPIVQKSNEVRFK